MEQVLIYTWTSAVPGAGADLYLDQCCTRSRCWSVPEPVLYPEQVLICTWTGAVPGAGADAPLLPRLLGHEWGGHWDAALLSRDVLQGPDTQRNTCSSPYILFPCQEPFTSLGCVCVDIVRVCWAEHTQNEFHRWLSMRETISSLAEDTRKCMKVEYLGRIEYDFQKSRVTGPWDHKDSVSVYL